MTWVRWLLVLAAFQMEVRVRALSSQEPLWNPPACAKSVECSVEVGSHSLSLEAGAGSITAAPWTIFEKKHNRWKILKGVARTRRGEVTTVYGQLGSSEEAWVIDEGGGKLIIRAIEGAVVFRTHDGRNLEVPEGFEIWVGGLDQSGRNLHGVPTEIPVEDHLRRWAALDRMNPASLRAGALALRERWSRRNETAAALYEEVSKRRIASVENEARRQARRRQAQRDERESYKRLLLRTAFEK